MTNPDKRTSILAKLVSASRAVVTYQTSLPLGCTRIQRIVYWLRPHGAAPYYPVFEEFLSDIRNLPVGTERLQWSRESLRIKDVELEAFIQTYRDRIFEACYDIMDRYATSVEQRPKPSSRPT